MARTERTPEEIRRIAQTLKQASESLAEAARIAEEGNLETLLIHSDTAMNRYIPSVVDFAVTTLADAQSQVIAAELGIESRAETHRKRHADQKQGKARKGKPK